jgi:exosortase
VFNLVYTYMATVTGQQPTQAAAIRSVPWVAMAWLAALIVVVYFPVLRHLVGVWSSDDDMGHGFFVPLVAGYMVWQRRARLMAMDWEPAWWGIAIVLLGVAESYVGTLGAEQFLQGTAPLVTLVGVLLTLGGVALVRELAFPLLLLPFMIPLPALIYNKITFPLQLFASWVAENVLNLIDIPTLRDGNVLRLPHQTLNVAEACSGIRSLLSLTFLSLVYGYFFDKRMWMRGVLFLATVPIAILANAGRVTITGIVSEKIDPSLASGFSHELEGFLVFLVAIGMLIGLHSILNRFLKHPEGKEPDHA